MGSAGLVALIAVALTLAAVGLRGAWDTRADQPPRIGTTVRWSCDPSLPAGLDAACDDAQGLPDVREVSRAARKKFGGRYAGLWIDRSVHPARLAVGVIEKQDGDEAAVRAIGGGSSRMVAVEQEFSLHQLRKTRSVVVAVVGELTRWSLVRIDPQANRVIVAVIPQDRRAVVEKLTVAGLQMPMLALEEYELIVPA